MSLTLVEAAKLSNDLLQRGVIELLAKDDPIFERLPFKDVIGNGLTYNVETTMAGANFYTAGDVWVESTSTVTPSTVTTKILGGDADVDNFLRATRSNFNDLVAEQVAAKVKAIKWEFMETLIYGWSSTETKRFDGIQALLRSATYNSVGVATVSSTPAALSLIKAEEAKDLIMNGKPDLVLLTKKLRRQINKYLNGVGGITKTDIQGKTVQTLFDVPIAVCDFISNDESCDGSYTVGGTTTYGYDWTDGTSLATDENGTTLFFVQFGDEALCGIQSDGGLKTERFEKLETKDATRVRIKWYPAIMLQSIITCSKATGISPTGTVTA